MKQISKTIWQYGLLVLASLATSAQAKNVNLVFKDHSAIQFSDPLHGKEEITFGPGWKKGTFVGADGQRADLLPMEKLSSVGGVIFAGPDYASVSPTSKYVVLSIVRVGVVDDPVSQSHIGNVSSRQYCPVLVTKTGCLISNQTGDLCGGQWDEKKDLWKVGVGSDVEGDTAAMLKPTFPTANEFWKAFSKSTSFRKSDRKLKDALVNNFGITNLMACEPPTVQNREAYISIARQLKAEGDPADAAYIDEKLSNVSNDSREATSLRVGIDKARLYDNPDSTTRAWMYLVEGDAVNGSSSTWSRMGAR